LERGFPEITKTIKRQVLLGVQEHNLTFLEIGQIIYYTYEIKKVEVRPMYGLGPIYNVKNEALAYFKALQSKVNRQNRDMEERINGEDKEKRTTKVVPQERKFRKKKIDLEKL